MAKHDTKWDCLVALSSSVLDVTTFLSQHLGGEMAILTFAVTSAFLVFHTIHPPEVIGKYAPGAVIGKLGAGGEVKAVVGAESVACGGGVGVPRMVWGYSLHGPWLHQGGSQWPGP